MNFCKYLTFKFSQNIVELKKFSVIISLLRNVIDIICHQDDEVLYCIQVNVIDVLKT